MPESPRRLTWGQALVWRMGRHRLIERATPSDLLRVVGEIGGLHAQVMSSAELSLWARIDGLPRDAVSGALWTRRTLVKLWAMRGTLHLLPTADLGMWLAALGTQMKVGNVGNAAIDALAVAVGRALESGAMTREALALEVERSTGSAELAEWVRFSWGSYLKAASFRGLLCFGPSEGGRVTFTNPAAWTSGAIDRPEPLEALCETTRRFLGAYGPATADDLMRWWEGPPSPRRGARMIAALGDEAVEVHVEGRRAWVLAGDMDDMTRAEPPDVARLLPAFDPWVIGAARGVAALLEPQHKGRVYRPQGWISPVVLTNGRMAGVWRHVRKGRRLLVEIDPFETVPAWAREQVEAEAVRLAAFLGGELEIRWTGRGAA